ncbi:hypothetical protein V6Z12_A08G045500 [Gossypium hirsutum]
MDLLRFQGIERQEEAAVPCVIVIGGGISGLAAARTLTDASFKVILLESRERLGGRIHTDFSFGCPVDMGASWLHGVCNENPLAPLISSLGLKLYRTSGDNSVLYDHDLESYALFDMDGRKVPQEIVVEVGDVFKRILKETEKVRDEHKKDMSVLKAISIVLDRNPELRQEGLAYEVMQWYICRMEAWFAADTDMISLKCWDQEQVLLGGHGLMVQGYDPIIKELAKDIDVRLNHRVSKISRGCDNVVVNVENGLSFIADAAIVTVPLGVLKANLIQFEPKLPEWKVAAISDIGVGHPILVYMAAGRFADDLEKFSDEYAVNFVMSQLKKMFPDATEPVQYLVSHWGTDPNSLGCYSYDPVGMAGDVYDKLREPLDNLFFGGEAVTEEHQGSVHGAYSSGVLAARNCESHLLERLGDFRKLQLISFSGDALLEPIFPLQISRM